MTPFWEIPNLSCLQKRLNRLIKCTLKEYSFPKRPIKRFGYSSKRVV